MNLSRSDLSDAFVKIVEREGFEWDDTWDKIQLFADVLQKNNCSDLVELCLSKLNSKNKWERLFAFRIIQKSGRFYLIPSEVIPIIYRDENFFQKMRIRHLIKLQETQIIKSNLPPVHKQK